MKKFDKVVSLVFLFTFFFVPFFLLGFQGWVFPAIRLFVFTFVVAVFYLFWIIKNYLNRAVVFSLTNFLVPLFLFFGLLIFSFFNIGTLGGFNDTLFGTGGFLFVSVLFFLAFLNLLTSENVKFVRQGLAFSFLLAALLAVFSYLGFVEKTPFSLFLLGKNFVSGESAYYLTSFFVFGVIFGMLLMFSKKEKVSGLISFLASFLGIGILAVNFFQNGNSAVFLPFSAGWAATIEIFKNFKTLLFGIGFNQFGTYSPLLRTPELDAEKYVFLRFPQTSNGIFEIINSLGVLGFAAFILIYIKIGIAIKRVFKEHGKVEFSNFPLFFLVFVFLTFLPINPIFLFLLFTTLTLTSFDLKKEKVLGFGEIKLQIISEDSFLGFLSFQTKQIMETRKYLTHIFTGFCVVFFSLFFYFFLAYPVLGETYFARYLLAIQQNKGKSAYEAILAASSANPRNDSFAIELSRVNFQLALSLNSQKKLTDQDRQNISVLVNQSIAAARQATQINPNKFINWENLGSLYQALMPTLPESADLAVDAFVRAVSLNPRDPVLRVNFAQMLYAAKAYREAISQLNAALSIKSDFANAYYNLALNYKQLGELDNAKRFFETAKQFVQKGSRDEKILVGELKNLEENKKDNSSENSSTSTSSKQNSVSKQEKDVGLTEPKAEPKLENLKKEFLNIQPSTSSATPTP